MMEVYMFLGCILFALGFVSGFAGATYFWTNGRNDLSGEYIGAAINLAEAVDENSLVNTRLIQFRNAKRKIPHGS